MTKHDDRAAPMHTYLWEEELKGAVKKWAGAQVEDDRMYVVLLYGWVLPHTRCVRVSRRCG